MEKPNINISSSSSSSCKELELDLGSEEPDRDLAPLPLALTSRVVHMLGGIATSAPAYTTFSQWLEVVRKRHRSSSIPHLDMPPPFCSSIIIGESLTTSTAACSSSSSSSTTTTAAAAAAAPPPPPPPPPQQTNLLDRLAKASMLDIDSSSFSWDSLLSLHRSEHHTNTTTAAAAAAEHSEDHDNIINKPLEVTVNSGGVVFFALFNQPAYDDHNDTPPKEAAAVIKISSSRMATQSERLGYEFAKYLGVQTPQARVIHNSTLEWLQIKEAAEKARDAACFEGDEVAQMTCSELLEALEFSRCLFLMSYVHGSPLLESSSAFESREIAEALAAAIGRILLLDLVIRNEDRLPCRLLRWRGNSANLLLADRTTCANMNALEEAFDSAIKLYRPKVVTTLQKERRTTSVDSRQSSNSGLVSESSELCEIVESPKSSNLSVKSRISDETMPCNFNIVAIDSGVPRRPPAGKRANDQSIYPKLVELLLNSSEFSSDLLHDITGGKLGFSSLEDSNSTTGMQLMNMSSVVHEFRYGFRAALRDLQGFHIFLLTLHQKLDNSLRAFMNIINKFPLGESDKEDSGVPESHLQGSTNIHCLSPRGKDRASSDSNMDITDSVPRASPSVNKESTDLSSPLSRDNLQGKLYKGSAEPIHCLRLTAKLRDFHKFAKVDAESNKELDMWNEVLKNEAVKLCQENKFNTGFFEGSDSHGVVDAYELKVRLEHILERIALISEAANTERPSSVTTALFIGGALSARSVYTLQHLGVTHVLCLCSNEIGQSDSQFPDLFEYKNFSISDDEDSHISSIFEEASDFIDEVERKSGKVLVHCFEGKSRSATVVLAYLMLRKKYTLLKAWNSLKRVHRRAQPNDGFAKTLVELDRRIHGKVSMEWQSRKPSMKVCPICGKNAGLSSSSLKLHLQKSHKKLSSGSVDSAMTMEIQKALTDLRISRGGSVSPTQRQSLLILDE